MKTHARNKHTILFNLLRQLIWSLTKSISQYVMVKSLNTVYNGFQTLDSYINRDINMNIVNNATRAAIRD